MGNCWRGKWATFLMKSDLILMITWQQRCERPNTTLQTIWRAWPNQLTTQEIKLHENKVAATFAIFWKKILTGKKNIQLSYILGCISETNSVKHSGSLDKSITLLIKAPHSMFVIVLMLILQSRSWWLVRAKGEEKMGEEAPGEERGVSGQLYTKYNITCVCGKVFFP